MKLWKDEENLNTLLINCAQFASKTLRKHEKVEGNIIAAKLFCNKNMKTEGKVEEYLKRALNESKNIEKNENYEYSAVQLVNSFIYYSLYGVESDEKLNGLLVTIKNKGVNECKEYYRATINHIKALQSLGKLKGVIFS